ncbi:hypothetical protein EUGRSUZ_F03312 [Eucalyptus grandis]|uniref:Uncharacterized protein n=2 Tax=Eucalyptus grandis TaxID=71139 RepID=A0ACC3KL42_EUCGR|nr:hypothetical protein EUGRSUZ_F03312 [Eucalyptus grandis]
MAALNMHPAFTLCMSNANFYRNRTLLNQVKELAARRDVRAIEEITHSEMSKDGRTKSPDEKPTKSPDEKPVAAVGDSVSSETETVVKTSASQRCSTILLLCKRSRKTLFRNPERDCYESPERDCYESPDIETTPEHHELAEKENADAQKPPKATPPVVTEVDPVKLKEMKREEEIAKAKQAMERKKKLAEKNAAKAAIKAQKEAEKKLKETIDFLCSDILLQVLLRG